MDQMNQTPATRWTDVLSAPLSGGEAKKFALTVCMRKLITIRNAMLKHRTPWRHVETQHA